ncbi:MAG TPA: hypothetical protein VE398_10550 [Acidobacteriota bacterium]|nr:hypothetical protein [Acidobacteriota bacterium]
MIHNRITDVLRDEGPLTGAQLAEATGMEVFALWSACRKISEIRFEIVGARFLRLDRAVHGYARLSPSIRREFLTYTLLGLENHNQQLEATARTLKDRIEEVSRAKLELARGSMASTVESLEERATILEKACFIIAGDVVYNMSHTVPRPEQSTGEMVRGSDLDIIAIVDDDLPEDLYRALDKAIYRKKHFLLVHPDFREEIDYILKNVARVREQLRFDSFESMVACKILREGTLLLGSESIFALVKNMLEERGIPSRLDEMERQALLDRQLAEKHLLELPAQAIDSQSIHLFYTREESEEIY